MIPTWFQMPCLFQMMTGLYCPGCGGTRAVRALLSGHPVLSFLYHPVVPYMASVAVWAAASWILYFATGNRRFRPELDDRIAYAAAGIVILNFMICPVLCDILHSLNTGRTQRNHKFLIKFIAET